MASFSCLYLCWMQPGPEGLLLPAPAVQWEGESCCWEGESYGDTG